jgi:hypothetical protein
MPRAPITHAPPVARQCEFSTQGKDFAAFLYGSFFALLSDGQGGFNARPLID